MKKLPLFDPHAHVDVEDFDADREELLRAIGETMAGIIDPGCDIPSSKMALRLAHQYPFVWAAVGIHPEEIGHSSLEDLDQIEAWCADPRVVAIGEIGLDYYWHKEKEEHLLQQKVFRQQMDIAREKKLPFIIHSRDAAEDTLNIVKEYMKDGMCGGIIHCFSYSKEIAREYLNMGLYLGIGGVVTFKNSRKLKEVAEYAPLNQILLETDCPYMAPVPNRGKRNSSLYLPEVVKTIAEIKGISCEEVVAVTESNALKVLNLI